MTEGKKLLELLKKIEGNKKELLNILKDEDINLIENAIKIAKTFCLQSNKNNTDSQRLLWLMELSLSLYNHKQPLYNIENPSDESLKIKTKHRICGVMGKQ